MTKGRPTKGKRHYLLQQCVGRAWKTLYDFSLCLDAEEEMNKYPSGRFRILREYSVKELVKERTHGPASYKPKGPQANRRRFHR